VRESRRRREILRNLSRYLRTIAEVVKSLDPKARIYLFGSVAEGTSLTSSDVDILIVTETLKPEEVIAQLWKHGIEDPFEIHVIKPEQLNTFKRTSKLIEINTSA